MPPKGSSVPSASSREGKVSSYGPSFQDPKLKRTGVAGRLWDFTTNSDELKPAHKRWLDDNIVPVLRRDGTARIIGHGSRLGSNDANIIVSRRRIGSVVAYLRAACPTASLRIQDQIPRGESNAAAAGVKDGSDDAWDRAVEVTVWDGPVEPPKPAPAPPTKFKTVISGRYFLTLTTENEGLGDGKPELNIPALLGGLSDLGKKLGGKALAPDDEDELENKRSFTNVEADYVVTAVNIKRRYRSVIMPGMSGVANVITDEKTVTYIWGPWTMFVTVKTESSFAAFNQAPGSGGQTPLMAPQTFSETKTVTREEAATSGLITPPNP